MIYPECFLSATAGFLPERPPLACLPTEFSAWDQLAAQLPSRVADLQVGSGVAELPQLDAQGLPPEALCRAASLLGILVHALVREQDLLSQPTHIPQSLQVPWEIVCARLHRPSPGMTYSDLILYNWRLRDPHGPREVENMELLTPIYGSQEERLFYLVMVETHAVAAPLVNALENLEQRIQAETLKTITAVLHTMTFSTLLKIDPNPYSPNFVDHLVWAKSVASFAFPVREGELGLSGGGSPVFHLLDALLGRAGWASQVGQELLALQKWMNPPMLDLLRRARALDLPRYAQEHPAEIGGAFRGLQEAYQSERGWLGMHRLKVYGFMEVGFKAGRTRTNGGFSGEVAERGWEKLDDSLEESRQERALVSRCPMAQQRSVQRVAEAPIYQVRLHSDLEHQAGDRLGIWPRNSNQLIELTLEALQASGDEPLALTASWKTTLDWLGEESQGTLRHFLTHAKLRPLPRAVGKQLLQLVHVPALAQLLEARQEDRYEVWEVLQMMRADNYDTRRLWQAGPWQKESLARILPPENRRIYSISAAHDLDLTIGALAFDSPALGLDSQCPIRREGTGSHFMTRAHPGGLPVQLVRPSRFALPSPERPVVMFAGGTGLSPFRGFWQARRGAPGATLLIVGVQDPAALAYTDEIAQEVAEHGLEVRICYSRCDQQTLSREGRLVTCAGQKGYVCQAIQEQSQRLWELLQSQGSFYICGQTRFAHTVIRELHDVIARGLGQPAHNPEVVEHYRRLVAEGRLMMDIFTTFAPADAPGVLPYQIYDASQVILHNDEAHGYWCVIQGQVYDLSQFLWLHPGGARLLKANAGLDATRSYEKVNHHLNAEVHASLDLYKIGKVRRLDFRGRWGVTLVPPTRERARPATASARADALLYLTLADLYRHWMRYVYLIVELENSLRNNLDLGVSPRLLGSTPGTRFHRALQLEILRVFWDTSLTQIGGPALRLLWHMTAGLCTPNQPLPQLEQALERTAARWIPARAKALAECGELQESLLTRRLAWSQLWLGELKALLLEGVRAFEAHQDQVIEKAGPQLTAILASLPEQLERYQGGL